MFAIGERQPPSTFSSDMPSPPVPSSPVTPGTQKPLYLCPTQMMYREYLSACYIRDLMIFMAGNCCCTASCTFAVSVSSRSLHPCNPFSSSHIFSTRTYLRISSASGRHQLPSVVLELLTKVGTRALFVKEYILICANESTSSSSSLPQMKHANLAYLFCRIWVLLYAEGFKIQNLEDYLSISQESILLSLARGIELPFAR